MENTTGFNLTKVIDDAKAIITNPVDFYRNMPKSGGLVEPLIFVVVMAVIAAIIFTIFSFFGGGRMAAAGLSALIIMPVMMLIGSFISSAIMFIVWKLMGSEHNYETAYRCVAYSMAILPVMAVLSLIPYLGSIIPVLWGAWLMFTASIEVHGRKKQTAMIVFGLLAFVGVITNLGAERASKNMEDKMGRLEQQMGRSMEEINDMSPEEAGKAFGQFMKGIEEATKKSQE